MLRRKWLLQAIILGCAVSLTTAASAEDTLVRQFSVGSSATTVGIGAAAEDVELTGPQALTSDAQGNLFVLDQINDRILRFNPKQPASDPAILKMPGDVHGSDLVVRKSDILVWDGSIRTLKAASDQSTRGLDDEVQLEEVVTRDVDDQFATSAFAQMGSQPPGSSADLLDQSTRAAVIRKGRQPDRQYVATRGRGSVIADIIPNKGDRSVRIEVQTMDKNDTIAQLSLRVSNKLGTVEFLEIDNSDRFYVLGENIPDSGRRASTFVARYASNGKLEGIYELPLENTPLTRRFVTVSGTGDVYFLRTRADGVDVVAVGFRPLKTSVIDLRPPMNAARKKPDGIFDGRFDAVAAVRPSNRQQTIETAFAFEGVQWKLTPANYGPDPDTACTGFNRIRRPWYLQGKLNQEVRGVPYCWGCHGSLANFRHRIEAGTMAGNVCTRNAPRTDVAGVDCSAFVSAAWGLSVHYTTAAIPAIAKRLENPWDLKPGDALNKPGSHVMLFLRFTPDRKAEVMEASTGGCNGRVCRNVYPLASLLERGFIPVRFRALADDQTTVAASAYQATESPTHHSRKARHSRR
jgi:hypothetical protein